MRMAGSTDTCPGRTHTHRLSSSPLLSSPQRSSAMASSSPSSALFSSSSPALRATSSRNHRPPARFFPLPTGPYGPSQACLSFSSGKPCGSRNHMPPAPAVSASTDAVTSDPTADPLDKVEVFDLNGNAVPISHLWKDRKAVIAFARHFGCVFCRKRADYLASKKDIMDECGVALVLIGPGNINQAKTFVEQTKFKGEVYADPNNASYEALRFVSGVTTTFTPAAGLKILQLYMEGYRQDWKLSFEKDTVSRGGWQQGGIVVAGPGKENISYIHRDKEAGDEPDIQEILSACCS